MIAVETKEKELRSLLREKGLSLFEPNIEIITIYLDFVRKFGSRNEAVENFAKSAIRSLAALLRRPEAEIKCSSAFNSFDFSKTEYPELVTLWLDHKDSSQFTSCCGLGELIQGILDVKNSDVVLDFGSGYGDFLAAVARSFENDLIRPMLLGQEYKPNHFYISQMVLEMCGANYRIENRNVLDSDSNPGFTKGYVFPPFTPKSDPLALKESLSRSENVSGQKISMEWLFVLQALRNLPATGRLIALLPERNLFRAQDASVRRDLLERNLIEGILYLPSGVFKSLGANRTVLVVLSHGNKTFKVVNGEKVLNDLPLRRLTGHEIAVDLVNAYYSAGAEIIDEGDVKTIDSNLTYKSLHIENAYSNLDNLVNLSAVVETRKGSPLTLGCFEDEIVDMPTSYRLLTSGSIEDGIIDYQSLPFLLGGKKYERFFARQGDVVMTTKSTKIKLAVIKEELDASIIVAGGIILLRPNKERMDGTFLKVFLDSLKGRALLDGIKKGNVISTIPIEDLNQLRIPCPPIEEQRKVSDKYNDLLSSYDEAKRKARDLGKKLEKFYDEFASD